MKIKKLFLAVLMTVAATTALAASVQIDYDRAVNFSQYHTYSWGEVQAKDSLWADRIHQGVDQKLQAKGWTLVTSNADIVIMVLSDSHNEQQEQTFYSGSGYGGGWRWGGGGMATATTSTYTTKKGLLVISMVDPKSKKLVWRGTASGGLSDKPEKNIGKLNKAIEKLFDKYPPSDK